MPPASATTVSSRFEMCFPLLLSTSHKLKEFCQTVSVRLFAHLPAKVETKPGEIKHFFPRKRSGKC